MSLSRIDAYGGPQGTERVVVHFDGPVPEDPPAYVRAIERPDAPGLAYTIQPPSGLRVCDTTHWFPGDVGTVDVLIPEDWLTAGTTGGDVPVREHARQGNLPAKVLPCGPHRGYVQVAIWGPASDDPGDVAVSVTPDGTQLVVDLAPA